MTPEMDILFKVLVAGGIMAFLSLLYHIRLRAKANSIFEAYFQEKQAWLSLTEFLACGVGALCLSLI
ncbi:hypothetical protein ACLI09_08625 [Flavobacterium sp. RHBU_24]|uniref:hypothetical protein n=1 Tax=Flavobacterium sp. RHBU_24 TaxID=3391185 RepID=UPI0039852791